MCTTSSARTSVLWSFLYTIDDTVFRPNGQPIQGQGIEPEIAISDSNWEEKVTKMFGDKTLANTLIQLFENNS